MLTTELCARLCADFPLQLPDAPACFACTRVVLDPWDCLLYTSPSPRDTT